VIFGVLCAAAAVVSHFPPPSVERGGRLAALWNDFASSYSIMRELPGVSAKVLLLTLLQLIVMAWRLSLTFETLGMEAPAALLLVLAPTTSLCVLISVVPGGIGYREGVMGLLTLATGFEFDSGLFAGAVDRGVLLAMVLVFGPASLIAVMSRTPGLLTREE